MRKVKRILTSIMMAATMMLTTPCVFAAEASDTDASGTDATPMDSVQTPEDAVDAEFDPAGVYHAAMGIQTCNTAWINRKAFFSEEINEYYGTDLSDKLWAGDPSASGSVYEGTFTDVELAGNGTYTVKLEHADFSGETAISQLFVATDIPVTEDITVTDFTVNINGKDVVTFPEAELEDEDTYLVGGMVIIAINHWRTPLVDKLESLGVYEDNSNGITLLNGNGDENITLTFTIDGFNYDKVEDAAVEDTTVEETSDSVATDSSVSKTDSSSSDKKDDKKDDSKFPVIPVVIGAVVVVGGAAAAVVLKKKKK